MYVYLSLSMCIYIYMYMHPPCGVRERTWHRGACVVVCDCYYDDYYLGSCRCALIGVPCRLSMLSTFSTFANVLF